MADVVNIPLYLARQLAHECVRCGEPAVDDEDYCQPHLDDKRERERRHRKTAYEILRKKGRCVDCRRKSKTVRCKQCVKRQRERVVRDPGNVVGKRGHTKLDTGDRRPGRTAVERYVGRSRRGAPSREDKDRDFERMAKIVDEERAKGSRKFAEARAAELADMPRIQVAALYEEAADHFSYAARIAEECREYVANRQGGKGKGS